MYLFQETSHGHASLENILKGTLTMSKRRYPPIVERHLAQSTKTSFLTFCIAQIKFIEIRLSYLAALASFDPCERNPMATCGKIEYCVRPNVKFIWFQRNDKNPQEGDITKQFLRKSACMALPPFLCSRPIQAHYNC